MNSSVPAPATSSALYRGRIVHQRLGPVRHRFSYRLTWLYLDLGEVEALARRSWLFSTRHRWAPVGFSARDHGPRDGSPLLPWVLASLAERGIRLARPRVRLLCLPRLLGYVFDPLSIYYCYDGERLAALLYEVKNTFGGQHAYIFPVTAGPGRRIAAHGCGKAFHVSPFLPMDLAYRFLLAEPGERLRIVIREGRDGAAGHGTAAAAELALVASQLGRRVPFGDRALLRLVAANFLMTAKVIVGIHTEALLLWWKGAPLHDRPRSTRPC